MNILQIAMIAFVLIEAMNIATLYFNPGSKRGNGVGIFNAFEKSKENDELHNFVLYLIFWVAGTKLIFILLLLVIIFTAPITTQIFASLAMILSILSFYWRLYPMIKRMDGDHQITPKGYSKSLYGMIAMMISGFSVALVLFIL